MRRAMIALMILIPAGIMAQECVDYGAYVPAQVGYTPIPASLNAFDVSGSFLCYAHTVSSPRLYSLNWCTLGDDGIPVLSGTYELDGAATQVRVDGTRAGALLADGTCCIVDFAAPESPALVAIQEGHGSRSDLDFENGLVAVAEDSLVIFYHVVEGGLHEVGRFASEAEYSWASTVSSLDVTGNLCWLLTSHLLSEMVYELKVLDISDVTSPVCIGAREVGANSWPFVGHFGRISADGTRACLSSYSQNMEWGGGGVFSAGTKVYTYSDGSGIGGGTAINSAYNGVRILGDHVYTAGSRLTYFRYADEQWRYEGSWRCASRLVAATPQAVWVAGATAIDTYLPQLPADWPHLGTFLRTSGPGLEDLRAADGYLILATQMPYNPPESSPSWDLQIYSPQSDAHLVWVGRMAAVGGYGGGYVVDGNLVYTTHGVWDVSTRAQASTFSSSPIAVVGRTLWTAADSGVRVFDLADPLNPIDAGVYFTGDVVLKVVASGGRAFLLGSHQLIVVDIANPLSPVELSRITYANDEIGLDLAVDGDRLFVSQRNGSAVGILLAYVVDDLGMLVQVGGYESTFSKWGEDLEIDGSVLYVTAAYAGIDVLDVADAAVPSRIGSILGGDRARQLLLYGDTLYAVLYSTVGVHPAGERVDAIKRQCSTTVSTEVTEFTATWRDGAARVDWMMAMNPFTVRILAIADGRSWVVPWTEEGMRRVAVDEQAPRGGFVQYELQILKDARWVTLAQRSLAIPGFELLLRQPRPNPFNPATRIEYAVAEAGDTELTVFDVAGRRVRGLFTGYQLPGDYAVTWDGRSDAGRRLPSGSYVARLATAHGVRTVKLLLLE